MNITVCRTQRTEAKFTCVLDRYGVNITAIHWQILVRGEFISVQGMPPRHMTGNAIIGDIITGLLTLIGVIMNDNGNQYRCSPTETTMSGTATLTVLGKSIIVIKKCELKLVIDHCNKK